MLAAAWLPGARDHLRALKQKYSFARQKARGLHHTFTCWESSTNSGIKFCMECGNLMDGQIYPICIACGSDETEVIVMVMRTLDIEPKIIDPGGA